ncbi:hypothetical protein NG2371_06794 [Nocardia gamkensis]|nr:hypothetical protein [Nocardia gamkensis]
MESEAPQTDSIAGPGRRSPSSRTVAVALTGGRGSQRHRLAQRAPGVTWRSPHRRPRIATSRSTPWRQPPTVAVALTGGRGSQLEGHGRRVGHLGWRSPSRTAEDRNNQLILQGNAIVLWRSPSRAAEDRNDPWRDPTIRYPEWRSPSRAAEDHNPMTSAATFGVIPVSSPWQSPLPLEAVGCCHCDRAGTVSGVTGRPAFCLEGCLRVGIRRARTVVASGLVLSRLRLPVGDSA